MNTLPISRPDSLYFHNRLAYVLEQPGRYVQIDWQATPMDSAGLRDVFEHVLWLMRETKLRKLLSNHQLMMAITPQDQEWLVAEWAPRAVREARFSYCAFVNAQNVFNRLGTMQVVQRLRSSIALFSAHFTDTQSAARWLQSCPD